MFTLAHVGGAHCIGSSSNNVICEVEAGMAAATACMTMIRARNSSTRNTIRTGAPVNDTPIAFNVVSCMARDTCVRIMLHARCTLCCMAIVTAAFERRLIRDVKFGATFKNDQTTGIDYHLFCCIGRRHGQADRSGYPCQAPEGEVVFRPMLRTREPQAIVRTTIAIAALWSAVTRRKL